MPVFPFVPMSSTKVRKDPLGPPTLNQLHANIRAVDELLRVEHFSDGQHNALEVPWIVGHVADGSPPTGYLFDTAFGGGTLARPATGRYTVNAVSGVVPVDASSRPVFSVLANVADIAIESKPHTIVADFSSDTLTLRVRSLSSSLGAGDTWADQNRTFDVALFAPAQAADVTALASYSEKQRGSYLTEQATDWNSLVANQGTTRAAANLEHTAPGEHSVVRIPRGVAWVTYSGGSYSIDSASVGIKSVSSSGTGVVTVTTEDTFSATTSMACFPEVQTATTEELAVINGRSITTTTFRFYIYAFDGANWGRADRSFRIVVFGSVP